MTKMSNFTTYISAECRIQITFSKAPGFSKLKRGARFGDQTLKQGIIVIQTF